MRGQIGKLDPKNPQQVGTWETLTGRLSDLEGKRRQVLGTLAEQGNRREVRQADEAFKKSLLQMEIDQKAAALDQDKRQFAERRGYDYYALEQVPTSTARTKPRPSNAPVSRWAGRGGENALDRAQQLTVLVLQR